MPTNKIAVITAASGKRDVIRTPSIIYPNVDYYAYVDDPTTIKPPWVINKLPHFSMCPIWGPRRNAKLPRILPELFLPNYDYYIWHDANKDLKIDPMQLLEMLGNNDILLYIHPERSTIRDEAIVIQQRGLDDYATVNQFVNYLTSLNFYTDNKLFNGGCFMKKASPKMLAMSLTWWDLVCKYSSRDQLSLPIALEAHGSDIALVHEDLTNKHFPVVPHGTK